MFGCKRFSVSINLIISLSKLDLLKKMEIGWWMYWSLQRHVQIYLLAVLMNMETCPLCDWILMTTRSGTLQGVNLFSRSLWQAAHGSENKQGAIRHISFLYKSPWDEKVNRWLHCNLFWNSKWALKVRALYFIIPCIRNCGNLKCKQCLIIIAP